MLEPCDEQHVTLDLRCELIAGHSGLHSAREWTVDREFFRCHGWAEADQWGGMMSTFIPAGKPSYEKGK